MTQRISDTICVAFEEDRDIIEAQQRVKNLNPGRPMMAAPFDGPLTHIRRMMDQAIEAEGSDKTAAAAALELEPVTAPGRKRI